MVIDFIINFFSERGINIPIEDCKQVNFIKDGLIDSFSALALFIAIESQFGVRIEPETMADDKLKTIGGLADYIQGRIDK